MAVLPGPSPCSRWVPCSLAPCSISVLDYPHCVVHELPELTAESLVSSWPVPRRSLWVRAGLEILPPPPGERCLYRSAHC